MTEREPLRISHIAKAPIGVVWNAWTIADQLAKWWGPQGLKLAVVQANVEAGGKFHYLMSNEEGTQERFEMWGAFDYVSVDRHQQIVFINYFSDAEGGRARHVLNPDWPLEVYNTLTFVEDGDQTLIHLEGAPLNAMPHEVDLFYANVESMRIGFGATFAQLDEFLAS
jgi:uncharacterized protein YndB with AHSA1/START domain